MFIKTAYCVFMFIFCLIVSGCEGDLRLKIQNNTNQNFDYEWNCRKKLDTNITHESSKSINGLENLENNDERKIINLIKWEYALENNKFLHIYLFNQDTVKSMVFWM